MFNTINLLDIDRANKRNFARAFDLSVILVASLFYFSPFGELSEISESLLIFVLISIALNFGLLQSVGVYRHVMRFGLIHWLGTLFKQLALSTIFLGLGCYLFVPEISVLKVLAVQFSQGLFFCFIRIAIVSFLTKIRQNGTPAIIYGAGQAGRLVKGVLDGTGNFTPVLFVDDDPNKIGSYILGLKVISSAEIHKFIGGLSGPRIFLAINDIDVDRKTQLVKRLSALNVPLTVTPSLEQSILNEWVSDFSKDASFIGLIDRKPNDGDAFHLSESIHGKTVLVTGAGGSIGSALCEELIRFGPTEIVMLDHAESSLFKSVNSIEDLAKRERCNVKITACLTNLCDRFGVEEIFNSRKVDFVFHAAAYKHVHLVEENPAVGVYNNISSCQNIIELSAEHAVDTFVLISTDKAVRPSNIMGASKKICELMVMAANDQHRESKFVAVRFGNVLGSSGSVLPIFLKQIERGGPVTVTHPDVTRYLMLIEEAVHLVIKASLLASKSSQVFILEMGEPKNILEIARKLIVAFGKSPVVVSNGEEVLGQNEIAITITGLKPGEKLSEELCADGELRHTIFNKILVEDCSRVDVQHIYQLVEKIKSACSDGDADLVFDLLKKEPVGLVPPDPLDLEIQ